MKDLIKINNFLEKKQESHSQIYHAVQDSNHLYRPFLENFLTSHNLPITPKTLMAVATRLVSLRDDALLLCAKEEGLDEHIIKKSSYTWVAQWHIHHHEELLHYIDSSELLDPFWRKLLHGVHAIGLIMTQWQPDWEDKVITQQHQLLASYDNIFDFLQTHQLLEYDSQGNSVERSYSVVTQHNECLIKESYAEAFPEHCTAIIHALNHLILELAPLEDTLWNQKIEIIHYLNALKIALGETDSTHIIENWRNVERAWMAYTAPIQIGHPLEYYEDYYRHAVALEWDIRIIDPQYTPLTSIADAMVNTITPLFDLWKVTPSLQTSILHNIKKSNLYIGRAMLYYGAEFHGLFSAQVVPNDEVVSSEQGKKIFAFAEEVRQTQLLRPRLQIHHEFLGEEFLNHYYALCADKHHWHAIYNITTIGHEYGHILWVEPQSESLMNSDGEFKNAEEFKATTGGLLTYFTSGETRYDKPLLIEHIKRCIGLLGWYGNDEVRPYFIEALIHLTALFESGVISYDTTLTYNFEAISHLKTWYNDIYTLLAKDYYCQQRPVKPFLEQFIIYNTTNNYHPRDTRVKKLFDDYWHRYQEIGQTQL